MPVGYCQREILCYNNMENVLVEKAVFGLQNFADVGILFAECV